MVITMFHRLLKKGVDTSGAGRDEVYCFVGQCHVASMHPSVSMQTLNTKQCLMRSGLISECSPG